MVLITRLTASILFMLCMIVPVDAVSAEGKSPRKAFFLSLLLPGLGEYYAGSLSRAKIFLGAEAGIWASFGVFRAYESLRATDARLFAAAHAGARAVPPFSLSAGTSAGERYALDFLHDLEFYQSRDEFNRYARWRSGPNAAVYPETDKWQWEWKSETDRLRYRGLRNSERKARQRSFYAVGVVLFNRLISGIDAARIARQAYGTEGRMRVSLRCNDRQGIEVRYLLK